MKKLIKFLTKVKNCATNYGIVKELYDTRISFEDLLCVLFPELKGRIKEQESSTQLILSRSLYFLHYLSNENLLFFSVSKCNKSYTFFKSFNVNV